MDLVSRASLDVPRNDGIDLLQEFRSFLLGPSIKLECPGAWHPCPHDPVDTFLRLHRYPDHRTPRGNPLPLLKAALQPNITQRRQGMPQEGSSLTAENGDFSSKPAASEGLNGLDLRQETENGPSQML